MSATAKAKVHKVDIKKHSIVIVQEEVAVEAPANIYINKRHLVTLLSSPSMLNELAVGHLFSEGMLKTKDSIDEVLIAGTDIRVKLKAEANVDFDLNRFGRFVSSSCGSLVDYLRLLAQINSKITDQYSVTAQNLEQMVTQLNNESRVFKITGGIHSAAIFENLKMVAFAEDVGRHNAVDKALGASILRNIDLNKSVLVTSGRQSADIVAKAAQMTIPISVSISGPIHSGIKLAERVGITLICFARGKRFNVYTYPERVKLS
ncbi:formate dehydrogenase accessory sulfurtransferase FdhD [[Eubacterium] cellulosolvens]